MTPKLQANSSTLKRDHPALQNKKCLHFYLFLWLIFALLNLDPDSEIGSVSTDLIESKSNPDPQQCTKLRGVPSQVYVTGFTSELNNSI
jgi:hypothetical protein